MSNDLNTSEDPVHFLPQSTSFIMHHAPGFDPDMADQIHALNQVISPEFDHVRSVLNAFDSVRYSDPEIQEYLLRNPLTLSFHQTGADRMDWAISFSHSDKESANAVLRKFLGAESGKGEFKGVSVNSWSGGFSSVQEENITCLASSSLLSEEISIAWNNQTTLASDTLFQNVFDSKNSNHLQLFQNSNSHWTGIEPDVADQSLVLHFRRPSTTVAEGSPALNELEYSLIPKNRSYVAGRVQRSASLNGLIGEIESDCACDLDGFFVSNIHEVAVINDGEPKMVLHYPDLQNQIEDFQLLIDDEVEEHNGYPIFHFRYPQLFKALGSAESLEWASYAFDHFILSESKEGLIASLSDIDNNNTLSSSADWQNLTSSLASNYYIEELISGRQAGSPFQFDKALSRAYAPQNRISYQAISVSISDSPKINYHPIEEIAEDNDSSGQEETEPVSSTLAIKWQSKASDLSSGPWLVRNHYTNEGEILWQDDSNHLHLVSATGKELWKARVDGQVNGNVDQIDIFRNDKLQMIFSTKTSIYCLDRNGNLVDGFPIRLESEASSPVAVFDYDSNRKYRLAIACEGGKAYNYTVEGKATSGWTFSQKSTDVVHLEHIRVRGKDYIFALEKSGQIHLLKRSGKSRYEAKSRALHHGTGDVYFINGESIGKTKMIYPDTTGNIVVLQFDQAAADYGLTGFSSGSQLVIRDINGDNKEDFVVADQKEVRAYNSDYKRLFVKEFDRSIDEGLKVYTFSSTDAKIGVAAGGYFYLIDPDGSIRNGYPVKSEESAIIFDLDRDGEMECIGVTGGKLLVYSLP